MSIFCEITIKSQYHISDFIVLSKWRYPIVGSLFGHEMMKGIDMMKVPVTCNKDCCAGCPLLAHVKDGRVTKITNNPLRDPFVVGCV